MTSCPLPCATGPFQKRAFHFKERIYAVLPDDRILYFAGRPGLNGSGNENGRIDSPESLHILFCVSLTLKAPNHDCSRRHS